MMRNWSIRVVGVFAMFCAGSLEAQADETRNAYRQWRVYGGGLENLHYSALNHINRENVHQLEVAWTYDTGDTYEGSEMQCKAINVNGVL